VSASDPRTAWDEEDLARLLDEAGFRLRDRSLETATTERRIRRTDIERWFAAEGTAGSGYGRSLAAHLGPEGTARFRDVLLAHLSDRTVPWSGVTVFLIAEAT
jgi:hypothetical protein